MYCEVRNLEIILILLHVGLFCELQIPLKNFLCLGEKKKGGRKIVFNIKLALKTVLLPIYVKHVESPSSS